MPVAILAGQVRGRLFAARRLGSLVADVAGTPVTGENVQRLVGEAFGDPTLTLARWDGDTYRDMHGAAVAADARRPIACASSSRATAVRTRWCSTTPLLDQPPDVVRGAAAGGLMLLENTRLADERGRLVEELRASRARIATATHEGQVRIERDLHDGVQPHLSALLVKLGIARDLAGEPELEALIEELGDDATAAVRELRTLARGVYPPLLRERGLAEALQAFAITAPVPVSVAERGQQSAPRRPRRRPSTSPRSRRSRTRSSTAAPASRSTSRSTAGRDATGLRRRRRRPRVRPRHRSRSGVGLVSMQDRIGAAGGELEIRSAPGGGTTVRGWVPAG